MMQDVDHHLVLLLEMMHYRLDLFLSLYIDLVVVFGVEPVLGGLAVLRHHDDRGGVGGLKTQRQVEQDERVWVPAVDISGNVQRHPQGEKYRLDDNKRPAAHDRRKAVRDALAEGELFNLVDIDDRAMVMNVTD